MREPPPTNGVPHSEAIEAACLGCLLAAPESAATEVVKLRSADFFDIRHRLIFQAIASLVHAGRLPDTVHLAQFLAEQKREKAAGGWPYIASLPDKVPGSPKLEYYLRDLRDKTRRRQAIAIGRRLVELAGDQTLDAAEVARDFSEHTQTLLERDLGRNVAVASIGTIQTPTRDDPAELIRHRFLCRGGGLLLCGPTGVGKSSLLLQLLLSWAVGKPCLGFAPARPLKSLLVQAENDAGDLAEMRDGVLAGLHFSAAERTRALADVMVATVDDCGGPDFVKTVLTRLVEEHAPDLLGLDPLLAYLGGDVSKQEVLSKFLREALNPLLHAANCGCVLAHHTNKPPNGREKPDWKAGDFAYIGTGSAELANWARAVIALRSIGDHDIFELLAAKRGARLDWRGPDGAKVYSRHVAHSKERGVICWREPDTTEIPTGGRPKNADGEEMLGLLPPEGLASMDWQRLAKQECGISERSFFRGRKSLEHAKRILKSKVNGKWQPILKA